MREELPLVAPASEPETRGRGGSGDRLSGFLRDRWAMAGLLCLALLHVGALGAPLLAPFDPAFQGDLVTGRFLAPGGEHLLGTDRLARDVLSRLLHGARISLAIALAAGAVAMTLGVAIGGIAGFLGGWTDRILMRATDSVLAFPRLVLLLAILAMVGPSFLLLVIVLGATQWPGTARLVRGEVLALREREFALAARALGFSRRRILLGHLLPHALPPVLVATALGIGDTIVMEAGLSFLGLGVQPPTPSWGAMIAEGRDDLLGAWWITTFAGLAIVVTVVSFNLVAEGLRSVLDPRGRVR